MDTKKCASCNQSKPLTEFHKNKGHKDGLNSYCNACSYEKYTEWRLKNKERYNKLISEYHKKKRAEIPGIYNKHRNNNRKKYPEKAKAQGIITYELKRGRLTKKPCIICNEEKVEAHHPDYSKPLEVVWLCKKHHVEEEKIKSLA